MPKSPISEYRRADLLQFVERRLRAENSPHRTFFTAVLDRASIPPEERDAKGDDDALAKLLNISARTVRTKPAMLNKELRLICEQSELPVTIQVSIQPPGRKSQDQKKNRLAIIIASRDIETNSTGWVQSLPIFNFWYPYRAYVPSDPVYPTTIVYTEVLFYLDEPDKVFVRHMEYNRNVSPSNKALGVPKDAPSALRKRLTPNSRESRFFTTTGELLLALSIKHELTRYSVALCVPKIELVPDHRFHHRTGRPEHLVLVGNSRTSTVIRNLQYPKGFSWKSSSTGTAIEFVAPSQTIPPLVDREEMPACFAAIRTKQAVSKTLHYVYALVSRIYDPERNLYTTVFEAHHSRAFQALSSLFNDSIQLLDLLRQGQFSADSLPPDEFQLLFACRVEANDDDAYGLPIPIEWKPQPAEGPAEITKVMTR